jgi:type IV pilus assembly protein PilA
MGLDRAHRKSPLVEFRAPRTWIFLSSLQEVFFSGLLDVSSKCLVFQVTFVLDYVCFTSAAPIPLSMHLRVSQPPTVINAKGFSLLELLVVVAIIGLLAAISIPQFISYRARGVDSQMKSDLKNAALAMESYFAENKIYPTSVAAIITVGFNQTDGVALTINVTTPSSFTITATKPSGTQPNFTFDSVTGIIN